MSSSSGKKPLKVRLGEVTKDNFNQVRKLNQVVFPVRYSENFYQNIQTPETNRYCKLAFYDDALVGAICCRYDTREERDSPACLTVSADSSVMEAFTKGGPAVLPYNVKRLYIMTLGVLAPYRGRGIAQTLFRAIEEIAEGSSEIEEIFLHVQTSNTDALNFYQKMGFVQIKEVKDYYKRIDPPHCYLLAKRYLKKKD